MNQTATYISDLLYRYECVILPEFGAFLTRREAASIQQENHAFFPPYKKISFNSQLKHNDGLLANYISQVEDISYTDAIAKIQRFVLYLQNNMAQGQRVALPGVGSFYTSVEDTIQFDPEEEINYLTESFGLSSFISPSIQREIEKEATTDSTVSLRESYKQQAEILEEKASLVFTPEKRSASTPLLKYAATAALIIGLTGAVGYAGLMVRNDQIQSENYTSRMKIKHEIDQRIQEATFEISNPLPPVVITTETEKASNLNSTEDAGNPGMDNSSFTKKDYHIIAGAFRVEKNARNKVLQLQKLGFNAKMIGKNKYGLHQVVYSSYQNRTDALAALRKIKSQEDRKAWLLVQSF